MKIARLQEPLKMGIEELEKPTIGPAEVLIKVAACGVCGTDVEAYQGNVPRGWSITYPFRMGHEVAGTVVDVGENVTNVKPGDRVVPDGRLTCGYCYYCRRGLFSACQNQGYFSGGLAQYSNYPFQNLTKIPEGVSMEEAAFAEPLACVINGQSKLEVPFGSVAVVIGDGPIGLLHIQLLRHQGAFTVMVGLLDHRLDVAKKLGANVVIDASREDIEQVVREVSDGRGADIVVNAVGKAAVLRQAIDLAARRGQVLYFAATLEPKVELDLDLIHYKELRIIGSYDSIVAQYEQALALINADIIKAKLLISHRLPLEEIQFGYEIARKQEGVKVLIIHAGG
ncbi:MAG: alcohol dehydrogenase catalytic domain-containing protein [Pseudomonadales bacterium]|jgi:L-iditol 2-dehydrogenase|nr:alcohol dehydrogenase catalytic domain-containing protein [Pseudomonadales bacterium]|tara:strand:+ start:11135 stop:12154 length:1020 start_codon:yes stop_codon:yes gene_type:complete